MSFASWYHHHYATWNRTRRLQQSPYIARTDTNVSRAAAALHSGTSNPGEMTNTAKDKKVQESLFGPNIGVVSSGPAWAATTEKKVLTDELTPDIVNSWIEKSKDTSQPTTTLQALVNLKRPTIRLLPVAEEPGNGSDTQHHHHGLEFEYDCDAPKCGIYVHVLLPKDHPDAPITSATSSLSKLLIFEMVVEGGFGKTLKIEDGALLDLGRFEHSSAGNPAPKNSSVANLPSPLVINSEPSSTGDLQDSSAPSETPTATARARRRFTHFAFKRRSQHSRNVTGPALAVVDAEPAPTQDTKEKDDTKEGVRVIIRLAALDEQGTELASPNEQVTYLHVVRFGEEVEEDARPWVVKVVKREATIGPHTFHLHEIYGLSSSSTSATQPAPMSALPASPESETHTYPPTPGAAIAPPVVANEEDPSSECLLCLSSPREVVLLPCRHLVACKDCALNMVEFGAGGNIIHSQAEESAAADTETPADGVATAATGAPISPVPPTNMRRKRKAKGWFCPVCRQPYTSLLRITTNPPALMPDGDKEAPGASDAEGSTSQVAGNETRSGIFGTSLLRGLSFNRNYAADVENQAGNGRVIGQ